MLNPLESLLFLTFLIYAPLYRPALAAIFLLLLIAFSLFYKRIPYPTDFIEMSKRSFSCRLGPLSLTLSSVRS